MSDRDYTKSESFARNGADLPEDLERASDVRRLFAEREVDVSELLVRGVKLDSGDLDRLRLECCVLEDLAAPETAIRTAKWKDVRFSACDLSNVEIRALTAVRVELLECRMTGFRCGEAEWRDVLFSGGDQRYAQFRFSSFRSSEFDGCNFEDSDFYGADLQGCVFRRCNLRNVEMSKANLAGADFRGSKIEGWRLQAEDVRGAIVDAAQALQLAPLLGIHIL